MQRLKQRLKGLLRYNFWFEHDVVGIDSAPYLERWFMYFFGFTFRVHKFYRGDDDRAPHDHPWAFLTFPLTGYFEQVFPGDIYGNGLVRHVKPWRFHFRPSRYQHIVLGSTKCCWPFDPKAVGRYWSPVPFYTIVITSRKQRSWGFWPQIDKDALGTTRRMFVPWRKFSAHAKP